MKSQGDTYKMTKTCTVMKYNTGFGWSGESLEITKTCILSIHLNKEINMGSLLNYRKYGLISVEDLRAIRNFDRRKGTEQDLKQIKDLANHLGDLEIKEIDTNG